MSAGIFTATDSLAWSRETASNGFRTHCMKTWNPINEKFETLSYLAPLSDDSTAKEIDYMLKKGNWILCIEFDEVGWAFDKSQVQCTAFVIQKPTTT
ncbi:hypothetical protein SLE2022_272210 [Rubroshorea leprosula]